jgi:hypothetical protein
VVAQWGELWPSVWRVRARVNAFLFIKINVLSVKTANFRCAGLKWLSLACGSLDSEVQGRKLSHFS